MAESSPTVRDSRMRSLTMILGLALIAVLVIGPAAGAAALGHSGPLFLYVPSLLLLALGWYAIDRRG